MPEKKSMLRDLRGIASAFRPGVPSEDIVAEGRAKENTMSEKKPTVGEIIDKLQEELENRAPTDDVVCLGLTSTRTLIDGVGEMRRALLIYAIRTNWRCPDPDNQLSGMREFTPAVDGWTIAARALWGKEPHDA